MSINWRGVSVRLPARCALPCAAIHGVVAAARKCGAQASGGTPARRTPRGTVEREDGASIKVHW